MDAAGLIGELRASRDALLDSPGRDIAVLLQDWAARWEDPTREVGEEGLNRLTASTGWPRLHLVETLRRAFEPWRLTGPRIVPRVQVGARSGPTHRDLWLLAILAGRIPALAASVVFRSLAARVPVVLKSSSADPVFCDLLQESARRHSDLLGRAVRVVKDPGIVASLVRMAPACVAYGCDETIARIRAMRPARPTWGGGHRESLVVVFCEALQSFRHAFDLAEKVASDCAIYDQSGCLSPHVVLCEEGAKVPPETLAEMLHSSLVALQALWPPADPTLAEAATLRLFAEESRFLAARQGGRVFPGRGPVRPLVVLMPHGAYRPGPGHRVIQVLTFTETPDFRRQVPSLRGRLQGIAVAGDMVRLDRTLEVAPEYRASYVCRPGCLQSPPADWLENGLNLSAELAGLGSLTDASRP